LRFQLTIEADEKLRELLQSKLKEGGTIRIEITNLVFQIKAGDEYVKVIKIDEKCLS